MMKQWYYAHNGERHGPVSFEHVKELATADKLRPTDLVWTEGDAEWRPAHTIDGLFPTAGNVTLPNGRVRQFVDMAASHGISQTIAFPAVWRLAWKLGIDIPPPHFLRFSQLLLWSGFLTSILIGILMGITIGIMGWEYGFILIGVLFGGLFGLCIAVYYFATGRKLALPSWSDFGTDDSDGDSVLPSRFAQWLKWAFSLDLRSAEVRKSPEYIKIAKWLKIAGSVCMLAMLYGRIHMYYTRTPDDARTAQSSENEATVAQAVAAIPEIRAKLESFRRVVSKYQQMPDEFTSEVELRTFNMELDAIQGEFIRMEFDPARQRAEARTIIETYESEIGDRYSGNLPLKLHDYVHEMSQEVQLLDLYDKTEM